jgi:hypothetical protein
VTAVQVVDIAGVDFKMLKQDSHNGLHESIRFGGLAASLEANTSSLQSVLLARVSHRQRPNSHVSKQELHLNHQSPAHHHVQLTTHGLLDVEGCHKCCVFGPRCVDNDGHRAAAAVAANPNCRTQGLLLLLPRARVQWLLSLC